MKKLINGSENVVKEMLLGLNEVHPELTVSMEFNSVIYDNQRKVVLISGGGSGHEPLDIGYVGENLLDAAIVGEPFIPPVAEQIVGTTELFDKKKTIIFIVKNFEADITQFKLAAKQLKTTGYNVQILIIDDDASVDPQTKDIRKRGVAGTVLIHKILGAAASQGLDADKLLELGRIVNDNLYTLGVAMTGVELPSENKPSFDLEENQIFYGVGIHGETGYRREEFISSELLGRELVNKLFQVSEPSEDEDMVILVNNLGNLTMMENLIFTNDVVKLLKLKRINPILVKSGCYLSSYNMAGVSITLLKIKDKKWIEYLTQECGGFAWK